MAEITVVDGELLRIDGATYPLRAISSVRITVKRETSKGIGLLAAAAVVGFSAASSQGGGFWLIVTLVVAAAGIGCLIPQYHLLIGAAGGERVAVSARSRREVEKIQRVIEDRIIGLRAA